MPRIVVDVPNKRTRIFMERKNFAGKLATSEILYRGGERAS